MRRVAGFMPIGTEFSLICKDHRGKDGRKE